MTTAITTVEVALDKQSINALRKADDIYAHFHNGEHYLDAIKRITSAHRERDPYAADLHFVVPCLGSISDYERSTFAGREVTACFTNIWRSSGIWQILRPGDRIRLCWSRGGLASENIRSAGYVGDMLTIEVLRKSDTDGRRPLQFLAATYVGPNNTARICR